MRATELLRLVWLNINQNRFKSVMTSIGIVAGAATIVMVIGIGRGGQMDIADQFAELNAGAIDISYDYAGEDESSGGEFSFGNMGKFFGNMMSGMFGSRGGQNSSGESGDSMQMPANGDGVQMPGSAGNAQMPANGTDRQMPSNGMDMQMPENETGMQGRSFSENSENAGTEGSKPARNATGESAETENTESTESAESDEELEETSESIIDERLNQDHIVLSVQDVDDIETFVTGITGATISYSTRASIEGGNLSNSQVYTVAGVKENFETLSRLELQEGYFISDYDDDTKAKVCILGSEAANEIFESAEEAVNSNIYIDDRSYTVIGVLEASNTVASGISPDSSVFIPYQTGIKYITGENIDPKITVIAEDVNTLQSVIENVKTVLEENYVNASFTFEDSGNKMKAAEASNQTLTLLLSAMAAIVFLVGGIGIMNVLFVSVKERTNEIGILKAIGTPRSDILMEFLIEAAAISMIGGILGIALSFGVIPVVRHFDVRVEVNLLACMTALGFAVLTGTVFGFYPAWKASRLEPVEALTAE